MCRLITTAVLATAWAMTAAYGQAVGAPGDSASRRPNVIVIVADDLGYADLGCQGAKDIRTPNIDSLAANGIRFTDGYVSCPVCSPTRAGLNTGRYQQRFGHEFNPGPPAEAQTNFGLPLTEKTFASYMKDAGYATGMVGKWHLGYKPEYLPTARGFDEFFGFPGGAHSYVDAKADTFNAILRGTTPVDEKEYLTDAFTREAAAFIQRHAAQPFFLYLTYNAIHNPMQVPEKYTQPFASISDPKRRTMAGMLAAMDHGVGMVLKVLRQSRIEDNTLIFFISDNGGPTSANGSRNDPFSGYKGQVLEGGIRVPFIVQWKKGLPAGKVYKRPVISLDILPTAVAAAGGTIPSDRKLDGVNLLPYLTGETDVAPHEMLYWRFGTQSAVRRGDHKLVVLPDDKPKLFNLANDAAERRDISSEKPEVAKELKSAMEKWNSELADPLWKVRKAARARRARQG
jgi:arylsulfatase A-like enzyme